MLTITALVTLIIGFIAVVLHYESKLVDHILAYDLLAADLDDCAAELHEANAIIARSTTAASFDDHVATACGMQLLPQPNRKLALVSDAVFSAAEIEEWN